MINGVGVIFTIREFHIPKMTPTLRSPHEVGLYFVDVVDKVCLKRRMHGALNVFFEGDQPSKETAPCMRSISYSS